VGNIVLVGDPIQLAQPVQSSSIRTAWFCIVLDATRRLHQMGGALPARRRPPDPTLHVAPPPALDIPILRR
jgi:hypothetical protein